MKPKGAQTGPNSWPQGEGGFYFLSGGRRAKDAFPLHTNLRKGHPQRVGLEEQDHQSEGLLRVHFRPLSCRGVLGRVTPLGVAAAASTEAHGGICWCSLRGRGAGALSEGGEGRMADPTHPMPAQGDNIHKTRLVRFFS